jgi:NAD(P)-dependent dehydrogenase (short-subunit alcohol dehydrogenase family)
MPSPVDLADRASIRAAVDRVDELHGRLDGAFNNGAAIQQPGPLDTTSDEELEEQFAVNFRAHWAAMTAEAALMRRSGGGAIVNTSSIGSRRANPDLPAYGAMKRALNSITETAAVTWAAEGIRVNGITPGGTATEMTGLDGDRRDRAGGRRRRRRAPEADSGQDAPAAGVPGATLGAPSAPELPFTVGSAGIRSSNVEPLPTVLFTRTEP